MTPPVTSTRGDLTFKHNLEKGRHGWLRLTPAYSIKLVQQILDENPGVARVLDPFSGTGTTGLVCGERGITCDLIEINPFLVWLAKTKTANYDAIQLDQVREAMQAVITRVQRQRIDTLWFPPISNIERWWPVGRRTLLAKLYKAINEILPAASPAKDLLLIAFCRCVIEWSNAAFNHQSMSFMQAKTGPLQQASFWADSEEELLLAGFQRMGHTILDAAAQPIAGRVAVIHGDSRCVPAPAGAEYDCVITSPPYPNRMSYIREVRPYMYWLKYLEEAREAGELDWQAIGGTWGIATSRTERWQPNGAAVDHPGFAEMIAGIAGESRVLANYVHKYFVDMTLHAGHLFPRVAPGGRVFYIVGNSKFYETIVPVEEIYAGILHNAGFTDTKITALRKRNSKKELQEFMVSAQKPPCLA